MGHNTSKEELCAKVISILSDRMLPKTFEQVESALREGRVAGLLSRLTPADTFYLAIEFRKKYVGDDVIGPASRELDSLCKLYPAEVSWEVLSRDFGIPHPTLAQTYARELLNIKPLPAFKGYASRLLAESWDSNNLYWARLADEMGYSPADMNRLAPELTRQMVQKIFATHSEDWLAVLQAMRETGEAFRQGKITFASTAKSNSRSADHP